MERSQFKLYVIFTPLIAVIILHLFSLLLFLSLDSLVHRNLYDFGLRFSLDWAGNYWMYFQLGIGALITAMLTTGFAMAFIFMYSRNDNISSKNLVYSLLFAGIILIVLAAFFLFRLDFIINHDLYQFGLEFSYEWATPYWTHLTLLYGLISLAGTATIASLIATSVVTRKQTRRDQTNIFSSFFFSIGILALVFSLLITSSILALIALGLLLWGALFALIRPEEYVKRVILDAATTPLLKEVYKLIKELDYKGKAFYLPPRYVTNSQDSKVYIPREKEGLPPSPEQIQTHGGSSFILNPHGLLITPPGAGLTTLFQKKLKQSFDNMNFQLLNFRLSALLIDELEIAQNLEIKVKNSKVYVQITASPFSNLDEDVEGHSDTYSNLKLGGPISSAIACVLAKAERKLVSIEKIQTVVPNKTIQIEYSLID